METVNETSAVMARRRPWNKGKLIGPEATAATEARLGHSDAFADRRACAGPGAL